VIHLINYDRVNQQDFLEKGLFFLHFYCISFSVYVILDFDIFVKNLLFQHVVMVQVIINIYVFIQSMIIHQQQRAILFILLIQLNNNSIETVLFFFLLFETCFVVITCECEWDKETDDDFVEKKPKDSIKNRKIKWPVNEN
jgi:hypothetical protein